VIQNPMPPDQKPSALETCSVLLNPRLSGQSQNLITAKQNPMPTGLRKLILELNRVVPKKEEEVAVLENTAVS
ncbi:MAG: hypothetical protein KC652_24825, partial [Cyanobacteria bacterium HKST-UBA01]|nr:hypothetical protein [Cyanobacteria bacterium HKST-UBA01]